MTRYLAIAAALLLTLAAPFALRPDTRIAAAGPEDTLVVLTPHSESIRREFSHAFGEHTLRTRGKRAYIEWRTPGGTSEISQTIATAYFAAFRNRWKSVLKRPWSDAGVGKAFANRRLELDDSPADDTPEQVARREFLTSTAGIGVDLSFGGGAYDFKRNSNIGYLVDCGITTLEPEWFTDEIIPLAVSGEPLRDSQNRWIGNCLSSFGIVSNVDQLKRLGFEADLARWDDLADPRLVGAIALADPTKSGSATKAFEMLIQEKLTASQAPEYAEKYPKLDKDELLEQGWKDAISLIQRISANARYFTDNAAKIPLDVAQGNAAAGMCIDFYGRTWNEMLRDINPDGVSRVRYLTPLGGSSVGADPIGMFRGAPNPKLAREFIHFVLSEEGQKLWNYRADTPGGPQHRSLRRMPIRRDLYTPEHLENFADPDVLPYEAAANFVYRPEWTDDYFAGIRLVIQATCLESHEELRETWQVLIETEFPQDAVLEFHELQHVSYAYVKGPLNDLIRNGSKLEIQQKVRQLREQSCTNYARSIRYARRVR